MQKIYKLSEQHVPSSMRKKDNKRAALKYLFLSIAIILPFALVIPNLPQKYQAPSMLVVGILATAIILPPIIREDNQWQKKFPTISPNAEWMLTEEALHYQSAGGDIRATIKGTEVIAIYEHDHFLIVKSARASIAVPFEVEGYSEIYQQVKKWKDIRPLPVLDSVLTFKKVSQLVLMMWLLFGTPLLAVANLLLIYKQPWEFIASFVVIISCLARIALEYWAAKSTDIKIKSFGFSWTYVILIILTVGKLLLL